MKNLLLFLSAFSCFTVFSQTIHLTEFASGFTAPVEITNAGDNRLFVVQQNGIIKILQPNGNINTNNFLNVSGKITYGGERGLLGLAFHPQYATNRYFFIYYNAINSGNIIVARYTTSAANPDIADANSEKIILNIAKPFTNHNGGSIHFDAAGYLWIGTGDGGSGGDPNGNAQNINSFLGKMLRIDINTENAPYTIPPGNPFINENGLDEIWSYGLRNPWKYSFDFSTNNVYIADVGQGNYEEINKMPITQGGINYGWRCYEANTVYNNAGCGSSSTMTFPVAFYDHSAGKCSVTGGYVYRGTLYPALNGNFFLADYCSNQIGMMHSDNSITWATTLAGANFTTFGKDLQKELYVAGMNGKIYTISTPDLGTTENNGKQISLIPNPAKEIIYIKGIPPKNYSLEIYTAEGRKVNTLEVNPDGSADISALRPGIYFVNLQSNGEKIYSQKLIVAE